MQMRISATIITLNEEDKIENCIRSVSQIVDEVLIVDSFSTDQTVAKAKNLGARILCNKFTSYVDQKNFASKKAKHDWILNLDADEVLSSKLQTSIQKEKKKNPEQLAQGYDFARLTRYCGKWIKHCGWYPNVRIRLYNRKKGKWQGEKIHERIQMKSKTRVRRLPGDLLHYTTNTLAEHVHQANRFSNIAAQVLFEKGRRPNFIKDVILNPILTFLQKYFFRLGVLDGYQGFFICALSAFANFIKYSKAWMLFHQIKKVS